MTVKTLPTLRFLIGHSFIPSSRMRFHPKVLFTRRSVCSAAPFVKVFESREEDSVKIVLKNAHIPNLNLSAPKSERVQGLLEQIQRRAELQREYSMAGKEDVSVCLLEANGAIDASTPNGEAWTRASALRIGQQVYTVQLNSPQVTTLTLPTYILPGCSIRPKVFFEGADLKHSQFEWYRGTERVGEGLFYHVTPEDIGCHLKVVCIPKSDDRTGPPCAAISPSPVEPLPPTFPFEERQTQTQTFVPDDCVRCVSYNILANMYVDKKRFPYASDKARDFYYRKQLLIKELLGYRGDVLCLQECQERTFEMDLAPLLQRAGYSGLFRKKGGGRHEGLATFVRDAKYKIVKNYGILLNLFLKETNKHIFEDLIKKVSGNLRDVSKLLAQGTALQVVLLESGLGGKLLVANTHLYSHKEAPEVRLIQAAVCTYFIEHIVRRKELVDVPLLFCGDFNSLPDSDAVRFLTTGSTSWKTNGESVLHHGLCLGSACGTPAYTNFTEEFQGCLDYMFFSRHLLEVSHSLPLPPHPSVTAHTALPSPLFPSDHLALVATLRPKKM